MRLSKLVLSLAAFLLVINGSCSLKAASDSAPESSQSVEKAVFYFLHSDGCPHCVKAKPFVESLRDKYPQVEFRLLEVSGSEENRYIYYAKIKELGITSTGVPLFVIGKNYKLGFDESKKSEIEDMIKKALQTEPKDKNQ